MSTDTTTNKVKVYATVALLLTDILKTEGTFAKQYMTQREKRQAQLKALQDHGVRFQDIRAKLLKVAKQEGVWTKDESGSYLSLEAVATLKHEWLHHLNLYITWIKNNYKSYAEVKTTGTQQAKLDAIAKKDIEDERIALLSEDEVKAEKAAKVLADKVKGEFVLATNIIKNAEALRELATKESCRVEMDKVISALKAGMESNRIKIS